MARQIMCSCDSLSMHELRASVTTTVLPDAAVIDETDFMSPGVASIKNPANSTLQVNLVGSNGWANEWWLKFFFKFRHYAGARTYVDRPVVEVVNAGGVQCIFRLVDLGGAQYSLTIYTGRKYLSGPTLVEPCAEIPMVEDTWYEVMLHVKHSMAVGATWDIWIDGADNVIGAGNRYGCADNDPRSRCCICDCVGTEIGEGLYCNACVDCACEYPAWVDPVYPACQRCDCPCDLTNDDCYPRHQTQFGGTAYITILRLGTDEGGVAGFDYWFDDIIFNDTAPFSHYNPEVIDIATGAIDFGSRLTLLAVNGAGDVADFVPVGSGNNWENVDELPSVGTDKNTSGTLDKKDLYNLESATAKVG